MKNIQDVVVDEIKKVYNGRAGCMCGCRGRYSYHPNAAEEAEKDNCAVSLLAVKRQLGRFQKLAEEAPEVIVGEDNIFYIDDDRPAEEGGKNSVIYLIDS